MILPFNHRARMARRIAAYHTGDLNPAACEAVSRHLAACPHCSEELRGLEETDRLLRGAAPRVASLPPDTSRALFARALDESGVLRRRTRGGWQLYAWATPAVLVLLGGGLAVRELCRPDPLPAKRLAVGTPAKRPAPPDPLATRTKPEPVVRQERRVPRLKARTTTPARKRLAQASAPRRVLPRPEVVELLPSTPLEWIPEPQMAPGVERVELMADVEPGAPVSEESGARLARRSAPSPVVSVEVTMGESEPAGTARVAAWWREPSGEWFWKQARVPRDDKQVELVLVSLSRERIWGYWKEETE